MPTGTFEADFQQFDRAVEHSTATLRGLEDEAARVGPAVDAIGSKGPSAFGQLITGADRAGTAMKGLGADAETNEQWLARVTSEAYRSGASLTAMEPAATTARSGLGAIAEAAGLTVAELGLVGAGSLVVSAAMAGWEFGRAIAGWFDLDSAIGNATAKLLGWGDVAGETAAAKADVLAKASKAVGSEITDLGTAIAINTNLAHVWQEMLNTSAGRIAAWRAELARVTPELPALTVDLASHNFSLKELAERYHLSVDAIQFFARETKAAADAEKLAADKIHDHNTRLLHDLDVEMKARAATKELAARTTLELTKLEERYNLTRIEQGGTTNAILVQQIKSWEAVTEDQLRKAGIVSKEVYAQLHIDAKQSLDAVGVDWGLFATRSRAALQETAANALKTYREMLTSGQFFREDLDKQLAKWRELDAAARNYGGTAVQTQQQIDAAALKTTRALEAQRKVTEALEDLERRRQAGGSFDVTATNFAPTLAGLGLANSQAAENLAHQGYSFQEIVAILRGAPQGPPTGPRIPGFARGVQDFAGGWAMVGERGPEPMYVPPGASIFPSGSGAGGGSYIDNRTLNFYGSTNELVQKVKDTLMRDAATRRQFGAA